MDEITTYKFAYGTSDEIKKGNLSSLPTSFTLSALMPFIQKEKGIILPKFVGIYQENQETYSKFDQKIPEQLNEINQLEKIMERFQTELKNDFHPNLIHIGHDSKIPPELVKQMFYQKKPNLDFLINFSNNNRIVISELVDLPSNFNGKDSLLIKNYFEKALEETKKFEDLEKTMNVFKELYSFLEDQLKNYGLTKVEFSLFNLLEFKFNPPTKNKIDTFSPNILENLFFNHKE